MTSTGWIFAASPMIFGIEHVRLELVDPQDPREHEHRRPHPLRQSHCDGRNRAGDRAEDRHEREERRDQRHHGPVLQTDDHEPDRREHSVDRADDELPANHARQAGVDAPEERVEALAPCRSNERSKEQDDALARQHGVGGEHQRDEEDEDRAAHAGHEVADRARHLEGVLLRIGERPADDVADDPVEVERRLLLGVRRFDVPPAVRVDDADAFPDVDRDRAVRLRSCHEGAARGRLPLFFLGEALPGVRPMAPSRSVSAGIHRFFACSDIFGISCRRLRNSWAIRGEIAQVKRPNEPRTTA